MAIKLTYPGRPLTSVSKRRSCVLTTERLKVHHHHHHHHHHHDKNVDHHDDQSATGCSGAMPEAYIDWVVERGGYMADELRCNDDDHPHHDIMMIIIIVTS